MPRFQCVVPALSGLLGLQTDGLHYLAVVLDVAAQHRAELLGRATHHFQAARIHPDGIPRGADASSPAPRKPADQTALAVTRSFTRVFFCSACTMPKKFSVLGLPRGASMR